MNKGTYLYMAPESYSSEYGVEWDILALGIVALEMLTGKPLYTSKEAKGNPAILRELWETKQEYIVDWSYEMKEFLEHTLQYDPLNRLKADELMMLNFIENAYNDDPYTYPTESFVLNINSKTPINYDQNNNKI